MFKYTLFDILSDLKKNISNFGYEIKLKFMVPHSIYRFYIVTRFILPTIEDIKNKPITFNLHCSDLDIKLDNRIHSIPSMPNMKKKLCKYNVICTLLSKTS